MRWLFTSLKYLLSLQLFFFFMNVFKHLLSVFKKKFFLIFLLSLPFKNNIEINGSSISSRGSSGNKKNRKKKKRTTKKHLKLLSLLKAPTQKKLIEKLVSFFYFWLYIFLFMLLFSLKILIFLICNEHISEMISASLSCNKRCGLKQKTVLHTHFFST